jgi:hypothetical protein
MASRNESFIYSAENIPVGGNPGDVLTKVGGPNYYTAWREPGYVFDAYDVVFDDGEY